MKTAITIISAICISMAIPAQTFSWAKSIGGYSWDQGIAVTTDNNYVYVTGNFCDTVDFDPGPGIATLAAVTSTNAFISSDIFVAKYDMAGNFVWARQFPGTGGIEQGLSIIVDGAGNVYSCGTFDESADFDPGPGVFQLNAATIYYTSMYVSKLDAGGNFLWAVTGGSVAPTTSATTQAMSMTFDPAGNLVVGGTFGDIVDFDPGPGTFTLSSPLDYDPFVLKLNPNGGFLWAGSFPSTSASGGASSIYSVKCDGNGDIFCAGSFNDVTDFDPGANVYTMTPGSGGYDPFVVRLNTNGAFVWAKQFRNLNSGDMAWASSIDLNSSGEIIVGGWFNGAIDFDTGPGTFTYMTSGNTDLYVAKLDGSGNLLWAKQIGGAEPQYGGYVAVNASHNIFISGIFFGTTDFDPGPGTHTLGAAPNVGNSFIARFDNLGNLTWATQLEGYDNVSNAIAIDNTGNVFTTGSFSGDIDFDPGLPVSADTVAGGYDIFVHKLFDCLPPPAPQPSLSIATVCKHTPVTLTVTSGNTVYWYPDPTFSASTGAGTSFALTPTVSMLVTMYAISTNTCSASPPSMHQVMVDECAGIEEIEDSSVQVFPVPASLSIEVRTTGITNGHANVFSSEGRLCAQSPLANGRCTFDVRALPAGVYLLRIYGDSGEGSVSRFVKD
jgi:hypothetical protein